MSFAKVPEFTGGKKEPTKYKKTEFIYLPPDSTNIIRVIDTEAKDVQYHYINRYTVKCLGDECPICKRNVAVMYEYPEDYREKPEFIPRRTRYFVNVIDKTPVRICPNCGNEEKGKGPFCSKCNTSIANVEPKPLNKVKVLSRGVTLFRQLNDIDLSVTDENGNPIGLTKFDIALIVRGSGRKMTITPIPYPNKNEPIPDDVEPFDLDKAIVVLTPDEMLELVKGVSLKDIFAARKLTDVKDTAVVEEATVAVQSRIEELFNN